MNQPSGEKFVAQNALMNSRRFELEMRVSQLRSECDALAASYAKAAVLVERVRTIGSDEDREKAGRRAEKARKLLSRCEAQLSIAQGQLSALGLR